ncbi:MOP flippase family protein [Balneolales bacterium ANBcel1]|nr:MOP flippase family protein [Balneolales bacterium ANBcel1]
MSLQKKAYIGMGWSGLSGMVVNSLELLKYIILARLLVPADFGLLAIVLAIIGLFRIFADGGTSNAVIHFRQNHNRQLSTLFWINILAGATLYLIVLLAAPGIAAFYNQPEVQPILWLAGLVLPIYSIGALYEVMLRKSLSFNKIAISESIGAMLGLVTATVLALQGWGVYSLIWAQIVASGTMTLFYLADGMRTWVPAFYFRPGEVASHLRFGFFQMGERGLNVYATRIDQLIIGRFFGPEILGAYHLAWQLILFPVMRLIPLLNRVAFPVFASRQDDNAILRNGYLKLMSGVTTLITPFFLIAALSAPWLVPLLFGSGWELAIQLIPFMALIAFLRMLGSPGGNIVLSKGRADLMFYWNLSVAVLNTLVFLAGAQISIFALVQFYAVLNVLYFGAGQWLMVHRPAALTWRRFLSHLNPALMALLIPWLMVWVGRNIAGGAWSKGALYQPDGTFRPAGLWERLLGFWSDASAWHAHAWWSDVFMVIAIATLFLLLYIPAVWFFQSGLIKESIHTLRLKPQ